MPYLLFLGTHGSCRSQMAEGFARRMAPAGVTVGSAGVEGGGPHLQVVSVMAEVGVDISQQNGLALSAVDLTAVDLLITLDTAATQQCSVLPGVPVVLRWELPELVEVGQGGSREALRKIRDQIGRRVDDFFSGGYLATMVAMKRNSEMILDHFTSGIIVHDAHRVITWFNRAAERITGYDRREVVGRDCHEIFPEGFCGGKCSFAEGVPNFDRIHYPLKITTKDGQSRRVEMNVMALKDNHYGFQGVLANFYDVTEVTELRQSLKTVQSFHGIIGRDESMQAIYELISDLGGSHCPVLIQGESGTGKELVAGAIHGESARAGRPFVTVNCGALPEGILESELFGHVRGAFTGAIRDKKGRFELADGGTIFLDEVAELSPSMQVKLLRVLQEGSFERVGGEKPVRVDVRVISATNKDLRKMVGLNRFREDLFYRLCVVPVNLPPLRHRRNDIPLLVNHFIGRLSKEMGRSIKGISAEGMHVLLDYGWPGNIRELQNAIQYAFVKCKGQSLEAGHLPPEILAGVNSAAGEVSPRRVKLDGPRVKQALAQTRGNKVRAAKLLGVGRATLYRFFKEEGGK